jgi:hypothetical protein
MGDLVYDANAKAYGQVDRILLRGAASGKSPEELSALTNGVVTPARAAQRVRDILASRDWLTQLEREQLILDDLMELKDVLYEKAVVFKSLDAAKPLISLLATIQKAVSEKKIDVNEIIKTITRAQASIMLDGINVAMERMILELERRHPDVFKRGEVYEVLEVAIPEAVEAVEGRVKEE